MHPVGDGHYFSPTPPARSDRRTVDLALPDLSLSFVTDRGVFSGDRVDPGTKLLLLEAPAPAAGAVVADVGCGYGPIACTMARRTPSADVWAVDVNERAVALAAENAAALGAANVRAVAATDVPDDLRVDVIYSNPPIRIGKAALHDLLDGWIVRLRPGGVAWLVVQKHLGADSLAARLEREGHAVRRAVSRVGYRLLEVTPCAT